MTTIRQQSQISTCFLGNDKHMISYKHHKLLVVTIHAYLPILVDRTRIPCRFVPPDDRYLQLLRWHWTTRLIEDWKLIVLHSRPQIAEKDRSSNVWKGKVRRNVRRQTIWADLPLSWRSLGQRLANPMLISGDSIMSVWGKKNTSEPADLMATYRWKMSLGMWDVVM